MFSIVSRFSFAVSFIELGKFFTKFPFSLIIPRSKELASKDGGNYNNVTFGVESFQSRSHVTTSIQIFTLVSLTFTVMTHLVKLLLGAVVPFFSTHLSPYAFNSLHTCLFIHSSYCYVCILTGRTFRLDIYLRLSIYQGI